MRRWNGWGDEAVYLKLPETGRELLHGLLGQGKIQPDIALEKLIDQVSDSRLPRHPLICTEPKIRIDHAHGQSLPDWIGMRGGTLDRFPDGVARPESVQQAQELLIFCQKNNIVVIPYGGGTSVVGHLQVPQEDRPVLTLSLAALNRLIEITPSSRLATFESGALGSDIETRLRQHGFTLGHYPQSFEYSSLGGWIATRSSGQQSSYYGRIEQLFAGGELITPVGTLNLSPLPASAAGPDLRHIVLGSEGRLGVLTRVAVRISPIPERDEVHGVFFPAWQDAESAVQALAGTGMRYSMIRLSNPAETRTSLALAGQAKKITLLKRFLRLRGIPPSGACMCLIGFTGSQRQVRAIKWESLSIIRKHKWVSTGKALGDVWKKNRFRAPYLRNTLWDMGYAVDTLETAVLWDRVTDTMAAIEKAIGESLAAWNETAHVFSHLSHVYATGSSIYTTVVFRLANSPQETLDRWQAVKRAGSQAIVQAGGTISHQHGVGVDHRSYLANEKGTVGMMALKQLCVHLDPDNRMNPTKLVE